jgi:NhaP-type Na+/H+ or K+/H+ antiporter
LDLALGTELGRGGVAHAILVIAEEIGLGLITGIVLAAIAVRLLRLAVRYGWTSEHWLHVPVVALAALCFATAQTLGGSGFIACFVGGLSFGYLSDRRGDVLEDVLAGAASTGEVLAMLTWIAFGGPILARLLDFVTWPMLFYSVLSLTVIRMVPVFLCLAGTGMSTRAKLFIGWFGPRGLASIVFAVIVFDAGAAGKETLACNRGLRGAAQRRGAWSQREPAHCEAWPGPPPALREAPAVQPLCFWAAIQVE